MKSGYWIKRILLFIPTVLLVTILTFLLSRQNQTTLLEGELDFSELRDERHPRERRAQYNRLVSEKGYDLPLFYFSIRPASFRHIDDIRDIRIRQAARSWMTEFDPRLVGAMYTTWSAHLDTIQNAQAYNEWFALMIAPHNEWVRMIKPEQHEGVATSVLESSRTWNDALPNFLWHGKRNQFHRHALSTFWMDFGHSVMDGRPVGKKISEALVWTLGLSTMVLILSFFISLAVGYCFLLWRKSLWVRFVDWLILALYAMPLFWLATLAIVFLTHDRYAGGWLYWFSSVGIYIPDISAPWWSRSGQLITFLCLPVFCMVLSGLAFFYLQWRDNGLEVMRRSFVLTARSKGLREATVVRRHVLPSAGFSIMGLMGFFFPSLISGSVIIEVLFNIPGMGRLMYTSIMLQDWNVVMAVVFIGIMVSYVGFILSDLTLRLLDPRLEI